MFLGSLMSQARVSASLPTSPLLKPVGAFDSRHSWPYIFYILSSFTLLDTLHLFFPITLLLNLGRPQHGEYVQTQTKNTTCTGLTVYTAAAPPVDYYKTLEISPQATSAQIREAYKRQALKHHPDRVPADSPERATSTKRFQQINDAYFTLSDATRRRDYDSARAFHNFGSTAADEEFDEEVPRQPPGGFPWSSFFGSNSPAEEEQRSNAQFGGVFEEMLREEGMAEGQDATPTRKFWSFVGTLSGGAMGFILANLPGAIAGAVAGNRLGAIRDARGKSVYAVFQELPQADKARLLSDLAAKVFAHAVGGGSA